jgi:hypothetical protein
VLLSVPTRVGIDWGRIGQDLAEFVGGVKLIPIGDERAIVVRTDIRGASEIRKWAKGESAGVVTLLTSGSIGKLKRTNLASSARDIGKVPE